MYEASRFLKKQLEWSHM